jgi:hypothetical protein
MDNMHETKDVVESIPLNEIPHMHSMDYDSTFDVAFCNTCDIWLEKQCKCGPDYDCPYSVTSVGVMPERPSLAK